MKYQFLTKSGHVLNVNVFPFWPRPAHRAIEKAFKKDADVVEGRHLGAYGWCNWFSLEPSHHLARGHVTWSSQSPRARDSTPHESKTMHAHQLKPKDSTTSGSTAAELIRLMRLSAKAQGTKTLLTFYSAGGVSMSADHGEGDAGAADVSDAAVAEHLIAVLSKELDGAFSH